VADTNVLVSAFLWRGTARRLIEYATEGRIQFCTSRPLLLELTGVLQRGQFAVRIAEAGETAQNLVEQYADVALIVEPASIPPTVLADPDDDAVLACAVAAPADVIVTGDAHLLALRAYADIPLISAREMADWLSNRRTDS
jgi:putative PIN family toxin of toxin-antitoxin system